MVSPEDPYFWSVDDLTYELCHNPQPVWASQAKQALLPPADALETTIRENVLDGESFMSMEMLDVASELGFPAFGIKRNIYKIIRCLRSISTEYRRQNLVGHVMPYINGIESPQITASHLSGRPQSAAYGNKTPVQTMTSPRLSNALASTPVQWPDLNQEIGVPQAAVDPSLQFFAPSEQRVPSTQRAPESDGRAPLANLQAELRPSEMEIKKKKRVAPTFLSHITQDRAAIFNAGRSHHSESINGTETENHYLKQSRQNPEETDLEDEDTEYEFVLGKTNKPLGQRLGIAKAMKIQLLERAALAAPGQHAFRRIPHHMSKDVIPKDALIPSVEPSENLYLIEEQQPTEEEQLAVAGLMTDLPEDLRQLLRRYPPAENDDGYAIFGESGDENEYDEQTWAEIEAEIEENECAKRLVGVLSVAEVNTAIDEAIEEMRAEWHRSKLPKVQKKGYRLWNKAARKQSSPHYIAESNFWLKRFGNAIVKLRDAISEDIWHKLVDVKAQSRSLEESVFQQEEHKYYLAILHSNEQPPRPDALTLSRARNISEPELAEGEEILESESEPSSDDGFIENDTTDAGSIPYDGPRVANLEAPRETEITVFESDGSDEIRGSGGRRLSRKQPLSQRNTDASDSSESELDSDLDASPCLPTSKYRKKGTKNKPIELMSSSPSPPGLSDRETSTGSIRTPSLNPGPDSPELRNKHIVRMSSEQLTPLSSLSSSRRLKFVSTADDGPSVEDVLAIQEMDWETIELQRDYRCALAKAVYELDEKASQLHTYTEKIGAHVEDLLKRVLLAYGRVDAIQQVAIRDQDLARCLGLLFLTYYTATSCMDEPDLEDDVVNEAFEATATASHRFHSLLRLVLKAYCSSSTFQKRRGKKRKGEESALDELDNDYGLLKADYDQENPQQPSARSAKKRKKTVLQSQEAETQQVDDRARVAEQERLRAAMLEKMSLMEDNMDGDVNGSAMHLVSYNPDAPIYLDPHIGKRVKPHQENGIQFMWREITAGKGCMLAHTMGLGKTMQVISLLITIAQASKSDDPVIRDQVPEALRQSRTLILCPPTLIDNWHDEIMMWTPPGSLVLGQVRKIVSAARAHERAQDIRHWARDGGVLLISYNLFLRIVDKKSTSIPEDLRQKYADRLTQQPNVVVADEAHQIKNPKTAIAKATKLFATKTRIALTGSPLSNHLEEYHQMVDWISPGYLGSLVQFKAKYSEPIKEGLYSDSTSYERKLSARKLLVLKRDLEPKICRADISAIAKDMPNKAEFFITVPLTAIQNNAYSKYASYMLHQHGTGSNARLWAWLGVLTLLLNHPSAFATKLSEGRTPEPPNPDGEPSVFAKNLEARVTPEPPNPVDEEREDSVATDDLALPADVPISNIGLAPDAIDDILSVFTVMTPEMLDDMYHSYRSLLTSHIVKESMRIHEKVLIFSHSIPTLNYLERMLRGLGCTYARIDGSTSMSTRQDMVKDFNKQEDVQVMLISTTAGGLGLNLQGANRVIIYDFNFNPTWEEQAIGRAYRLGQQKHVFVYRFRAGGTFEETIYNMSIFKTQLFARVVDKRNPMRFASKRLSDYLFPPRHVEQTDLDECRGKDPQVLDLIMAKETCIRKVELTETFQVEEDDDLTPEELKQAEQEYQDEVLARTDPGELARLQWERLRKARQEVRGQRMPQVLSTQGRAPQQTTRTVSTTYPMMPNDLRFTTLAPSPPGTNSDVFSTSDDTQIDRPVRPRSNSGISQMDVSEDERIEGCEQQ